MPDIDDADQRRPWTTPELRHTDANTTEIGPGPLVDTTVEGTSFSIV